MTHKSDDESRRAFEKWKKSEGETPSAFILLESGHYNDSRIQGQWQAWQARDAYEKAKTPSPDVVEPAFQKVLSWIGKPDDEFNQWHLDEGHLREFVYKTIAAMNEVQP